MSTRIQREIVKMEQQREIEIERIAEHFRAAQKTVQPLIDREAATERVPADIMNLPLDAALLNQRK